MRGPLGDLGSRKRRMRHSLLSMRLRAQTNASTHTKAHAFAYAGLFDGPVQFVESVRSDAHSLLLSNNFFEVLDILAHLHDGFDATDLMNEDGSPVIW